MKKSVFFTIYAILQCICNATVYVSPNDKWSIDVSYLNIDVDRIAELSGHLSTIAKREHDPMNPSSVRNSAKLLYLALMLNPDNEKAHELNNAYIANNNVKFLDNSVVERSVSKVMRFVSHFSKNKSNKLEQTISLMIKDCIIDIQPKHPGLKDHKKSITRWKGKVSDVLVFSKAGQRPNSGKVNSNTTLRPRLSRKLLRQRHRDLAFSVSFFNKIFGIRNNTGKRPIKQDYIKWSSDEHLNYITLNEKSHINFQEIGSIERDQKFSIDAWIKPGSGNTGSIMSKMDANTNSRGWCLWMTDNHLMFEMNHEANNNWLKVISKKQLPENQWSHIVVTYDGSSKARGVSLYLNGEPLAVKIGADSLSDTIKNSAMLTFGQRYKGEMDLSNCGIAYAKMLKLTLDATAVKKMHNRHTLRESKNSTDNVPNNPEDTEKNALLDLKFFDKKRTLKDQYGEMPTVEPNAIYTTHKGISVLSLKNGGYLSYTKNHADIEGKSPFTVDLWFNNFKSDNSGCIVAKMDEKEKHRGWDVWLTSNKVCFHIIHSFPGNSLKVISEQKIPVNRWSNVSITYDGSMKASGVRMYIDGKICTNEVVENTLSDSARTETPLMIGRRLHGSCQLREIVLSSISVKNGVANPEDIKNTADRFLKHLNAQIDKPDTEESTKGMVGNMARPEGALKMHKREISILSPMIQAYTVDERWKYKTVLAKIKIFDEGIWEPEESEEDEEDEEEKEEDPQDMLFKILLDPKHSKEDTVRTSSRWIHHSISKIYGDVERFRARVQTSEMYSTRNSQSLAGPVAVAMGASLMNKEIIEGTTVCAQTQGKGKLYRPTTLWKQLPGLLNSTKPHLVIIGRGAADDFKQILVFKKPGFFILNEVVETFKLEDAVEAATGSDPDLNKASEIFKGLQEEYDEGDIARIAYNPIVRKKLNQILDIYPAHISAKMILLWGDNARPKTLDKKFAYWTLLEIHKKLERYEERDVWSFNSKIIKPLAEQLNAEGEELKEYLEGDEKDFLEEILSCLPLAESIARNKEKRIRTATANLKVFKEKIINNQKKFNEFYKQTEPKKEDDSEN